MERVAVGRVVGTQGRRGEIKVLPEARDPNRFASLKRVFVEGIEGPTNGYAVLDVWEHKGAFIMRLEHIEDIDQAERTVGRQLWVPESEAVALADDEYFVHDLIGLDVVGDGGRELGVLEEVISGPANDVYVVRGPFGELL